jgi:uncharacterized protein YjiK
MRLTTIALSLSALAAAGWANAATPIGSIELGNYRVSGSYALDTLGGLGLEASAVTYARDRGSLFVVPDEGLGVVEISRTGQTLSTMTFSGWPAASTSHDAEGLTYLGGAVLVVAEERLQDAFRFTYVPGGSANLAAADFVSIGPTVGNVGTEGLSYDLRNATFVSVKQDTPQGILAGSLSFAPGGGISTMAPLFDPALLGLASLSDVQTLSPVDALMGQPAADNVLILSLGSRRIVETNRAGAILSSFDLSVLTEQAIEGVTVDEHGTIYLVAEDSGFGSSRLFVLTPVPEPETYAMMLMGLGLVAGKLRGRIRRACSAQPTPQRLEFDEPDGDIDFEDDPDADDDEDADEIRRFVMLSGMVCVDGLTHAEAKDADKVIEV